MAIVGFDNLTESPYFHPALTTITNPLRELGVLAVKTLLEQIDGHTQPENIATLPTELIVRASTP
jgi:DNA-binding LacI/PurR family transcriptional regulator